MPLAFPSYSPNLGSMMEDIEDQGSALMEEGEIPDNIPQAGHQRRSLSQNFTAPRFAALAAQQEQSDLVGPSGRPQLAPGFMFGARRRPSSAMPMGPPINEEDVGFQFPQQQTQPSYSLDAGLDANRRKHDNSAEISGIMAEQIALQNQIEALQQQQQALYKQQLASNQVLSFQTPGLVPGRGGAHRRVQSTIPMGMGINAFAGPQAAMGQFGNISSLGVSVDAQPPGVPRGHGRRHSVNVLNKSSGAPSLNAMGFSQSQDGFEDGFTPPPALGSGGHVRTDSTWRISKSIIINLFTTPEMSIVE